MDRAALRLKIEEILNNDPEINPIIAERVNQIANDAIASMPEQPVEASRGNPKEEMVKRLKARVETITEPPELVEKLQAVVAEIEAAVAEEPAA